MPAPHFELATDQLRSMGKHRTGRKAHASIEGVDHRMGRGGPAQIYLVKIFKEIYLHYLDLDLCIVHVHMYTRIIIIYFECITCAFTLIIYLLFIGSNASTGPSS